MLCFQFSHLAVGDLDAFGVDGFLELGGDGQAGAGSGSGDQVEPALTIAWPSASARVLGVGLLVLSAWLVRYDVARHTVHAHGLTRYMAVCLLSGYVLMAVAAVMWTWNGTPAQGPAYHATLVGSLAIVLLATALPQS